MSVRRHDKDFMGFVTLGKFWHSNLKQDMTAFFHILSSSLFISHNTVEYYFIIRFNVLLNSLRTNHMDTMLSASFVLIVGLELFGFSGSSSLNLRVSPSEKL